MSVFLVTGGAGFIGSNLVYHLLEKRPDAKVVVFDALTYAGNLDNLANARKSERFEFVHGDIRNREHVRQAFESHAPTTVLHLAAESHVDRSIDGPRVFLETNIMGTFELLAAAREHFEKGNSESFRFVQVSTDEVYGSLGAEGLFHETTAYAPNSPYAASKAAADHLARAFGETYRLPTVTTNCSNNYGPYQFPEKLVPLVTLNALDGKTLPVYGDGSNVRDWLFVQDHCAAILLAAERGRLGECYNVGASTEKTTLEMVHAICDVLGELRPREEGSYRDLIQFVKDRPGHDQRYAIDANKIQKELGWAPATNFEQGMRKTVQWYLDNTAWCASITSGNYQRQRLGLKDEAEEA